MSSLAFPSAQQTEPSVGCSGLIISSVMRASVTEVTSLTLVANFSPLAILGFGDHKQLSPPIFSKFQHREYKPPKSFRKGGSGEQNGLTSPKPAGMTKMMLPKTQRHRKTPRTSEPKRKSGTRAAIRASRKTPTLLMPVPSRRKFSPTQRRLPTRSPGDVGYSSPLGIWTQVLHVDPELASARHGW